MLSAIFVIMFTLSFSFAEVPVFQLKAKSLPKPLSFTQGIEIRDGIVHESSGRFGQSYISRWNLKSQAILNKLPLSNRYFAEGLTHCAGKWYLLTWKSGQVFQVDSQFSKMTPIWKIPGEGWGLSCYQDQLIYSNGSSWLYFVEPNSGQILGQIEVLAEGVPLNKLNEMEVVQDYLLINRWYQWDVLVFDLKSQKVVEIWDASSLKSHFSAQQLSEMDSMNGIAFDSQSKKFYLTGKLWNKIFEIKAPQGSQLAH